MGVVATLSLSKGPSNINSHYIYCNAEKGFQCDRSCSSELLRQNTFYFDCEEMVRDHGRGFPSFFAVSSHVPVQLVQYPHCALPSSHVAPGFPTYFLLFESQSISRPSFQHSCQHSLISLMVDEDRCLSF